MGIIVYIIVFGLVLLILAPFFVGHFRNVQKDRMMIKALNDSGIAAGISLSESDSWKGTYAIGIGNDPDRLVYLSKAGGSLQEVSADLSAARDCRTDVIARTEKTPNGSMTVVEAISLIITFNDKALSEKRLEFYSNEFFHSPGNERVLAEKWQKIVSSAIQAKNR